MRIKSYPKAIITTIYILICCLVSTCSDENVGSTHKIDQRKAISATQVAVETGDLSEIRTHGVLRILLPQGVEGDDYLPRLGSPLHAELELMEKFTDLLGLQPQWIYVETAKDLIPMLVAGRGDVIAANMTITAKRKETIKFTVPLNIVREQIVARKNEAIEKIADLAGRTISVHKHSSFWQTLQELKKAHPFIQVLEAPEHLSTALLLEGVEDNEFDLAIADSNVIKSVFEYRRGLKVAFDVSSDRAIGWGVRPNSELLLQELNRFLSKEKLVEKKNTIHKDDLAQIKDRKVLRVLTRNNAATYFLWRGELLGFEYELVRKFASMHGLRIEMVVPPSREELISWLIQGKGDLIAASLTNIAQRVDQGIAFSTKYNIVTEILVARMSDEKITDKKSLSGRTVGVRKSSSYWNTLQNIRNSGIDFTIKAVSEDIETEEIIDKVAKHEIDLTVSDSHILDIELTWRDDVKGVFSLGDPVEHGWAVRKENSQLLDAVDKFIEKEYKGLFYNITHKKYFQNPHKILTHVEFRTDGTNAAQLSPYDDTVKRICQDFGFDWRLIVAQMYQESRFDPSAKSWVGALGLMQVLPRTAKQFNISQLNIPEKGIEAGVRYLDWLVGRFEPELPVKDRMWFILAAYNAGVGHVRDARQLAKRKGWQQNRWFGHVEKAMLLLSKRKYANTARHGYVRGREPVNYVREIRDRYTAYVNLTQSSSHLSK